MAAPADPEGFFAGSDLGLAVYRAVRAVVEGLGAHEVRTSKSQVAFRRHRVFALLWRPGQYLDRPGAEVVVTIALGRRDDSPRFKEIAHPSPRQWMHHLEVGAVDEVDEQVEDWLREAYERAG